VLCKYYCVYVNTVLCLLIKCCVYVNNVVFLSKQCCLCKYCVYVIQCYVCQYSVVFMSIQCCFFQVCVWTDWLGRPHGIFGNNTALTFKKQIIDLLFHYFYFYFPKLGK
jgi:hypothetical protein